MSKAAELIEENARQDEYLARHIDVFCDEFPETLRFIVPMPFASLSPNANVHHMARGGARRRYRELCYIYAKRALIEQGQNKRYNRAVIHYRFINTGIRPSWSDVGLHEAKDGFYIPRDKDNARGAMKSAQDGLADALLVGDADDYDIVEMGYVAIIKEPKKRDRKTGPFPYYSHVEVIIQGSRTGKTRPSTGKGRARTKSERQSLGKPKLGRTGTRALAASVRYSEESG